MKLRRVINGIILMFILCSAFNNLDAQMNLKGKGHIGAFNNGGKIYYYGEIVLVQRKLDFS